ncbi:MAG: CO dehydrogenase/acetyl-CoA synthase complex subunit epsilon [Candidatus Bathyarchaeia archaeon]
MPRQGVFVTSAKFTLGQTAEIPGPKKAFLISKPEIVAAMIKRMKRTVFVIGSESLKLKNNDGDLVDIMMRISNLSKSPIVATGNMFGEFKKRNAKNVYSMSLMNLGERLRDQQWGGLDGKGPYDLAIFCGLPYYMEWLVLSGLKNFAPYLTTISLDNTYHPNATWSLGYLQEKDWMASLDKIASILEAS